MLAVGSPIHVSFVKYPHNSPVADQLIQRATPLFRSAKTVAAFGDPLTLAAFSYVQQVRQSLIGCFTTEQEAVSCAQTDRPDILFCTEELAQGYGINLVERVKSVSPLTKCVIFLRRESQDVVMEAMDSGADGIVFISSIGGGVDGDFYKALERVVSGGTYIPSDVEDKISMIRPPGWDDLSKKELEVIYILADGLSNKEISEQLFVSVETVKSHLNSIYSKLAVRSRAQAAILASKVKSDSLAS